MKKTKHFITAAILIIICQLSVINCFAQTIVAGGFVKGHWTLAGSPYNITGSIQIKSDSTLIIDPGVTVSFQTANKLKMLVYGRLLAVGTAAQNIFFTASDHTNGFEGIRFMSPA